MRRNFSFFGFVICLVLLLAPNSYCGDVDLSTARIVAESTLRRHVALYGDWNGVSDPTISSGEAVNYNDTVVAYNFQIAPGGHVLVAVEDALSPVLLYSTSSSFDSGRAQQPNAIESWIVPELKHQVEAVNAYRRSGESRLRSLAGSAAAQRIAAAWAAHTSGVSISSQRGFETSTADAFDDERPDLVRTASVGPLMTTAWGQDAPYNLMAPDDSCPSGHTLTGCVATAWAQLLRYWSWPIRGTSSHTYTWVSSSGPVSMTVDFDNSVDYQWDLMLDNYTSGYTPSQGDAVALLMYHMGVAADMQFGCNGSGSSAWADDVLGVYFKYQSDTLQYFSRASISTSGQWFDLIREELDADPPRPVVFSIFESGGGGHEVIIDGYQTSPDSPTDMVHINYGWLGYEDGFYNITIDFSAGSYTWDANDQHIVTGIEPDNDPPVVDAGSDQTVGEETIVSLGGSATDSDSVGISSYLWTQVSGPTVTLSDTSITNPTFTSPNVHSETIFVFQLRADDTNRAHAEDTCTITITNTDGSTTPVADAGDDQSVGEETVVDLSGSATDPNSAGISSYLWTQLSGPTVTLSNAASTDASFTAPNVDTTTTMAFRFRADYDDGDSATDTCTITVNNTDGSYTHVIPPSYDSGGGGGCFISHLH